MAHETIVEKVTSRWAVTASGVMFSLHADEAGPIRQALDTGLALAETGESRVLVRSPDGRLRAVWDSMAQGAGKRGLCEGAPGRPAVPNHDAGEI